MAPELRLSQVRAQKADLNSFKPEVRTRLIKNVKQGQVVMMPHTNLSHLQAMCKSKPYRFGGVYDASCDAVSSTRTLVPRFLISDHLRHGFIHSIPL